MTDTTARAINFTAAELALLETVLDANEERLATRWGVQSLDDFIHLLTMHGLDEFSTLPFCE